MNPVPPRYAVGAFTSRPRRSAANGSLNNATVGYRVSSNLKPVKQNLISEAIPRPKCHVLHTVDMYAYVHTCMHTYCGVSQQLKLIVDIVITCNVVGDREHF